MEYNTDSQRYETEVTRLRRELYFCKANLSKLACNQMLQRQAELLDTGIARTIRLAKSQPWYALHVWG